MLKKVIAILALSPLWQWLTLSEKKDAVRYVIRENQPNIRRSYSWQ
jgi:hypothetical protein